MTTSDALLSPGRVVDAWDVCFKSMIEFSPSDSSFQMHGLAAGRELAASVRFNL